MHRFVGRGSEVQGGSSGYGTAQEALIEAPTRQHADRAHGRKHFLLHAVTEIVHTQFELQGA